MKWQIINATKYGKCDVNDENMERVVSNVDLDVAKILVKEHNRTQKDIVVLLCSAVNKEDDL